jgi:hypothetical protein
MCELKHLHTVTVKHILRYVLGTITYGLRYTSSGGVLLHGFTDSNWMGVKFIAAARAILREDGKDPS